MRVGVCTSYWMTSGSYGRCRAVRQPFHIRYKTLALSWVWRRRTVPIPSIHSPIDRVTASTMVSSLRPSEPTQRLVAQLHALSELMESLAFRVVELEERLAATEQKLQPLLGASGSERAPLDSDPRLLDTEARIARLEAWLSGAGALRPVSIAAEMPVAQALEPDSIVEESGVPFDLDLAA
jgi:hypothetical protein